MSGKEHRVLTGDLNIMYGDTVEKERHDHLLEREERVKRPYGAYAGRRRKV